MFWKAVFLYWYIDAMGVQLYTDKPLLNLCMIELYSHKAIYTCLYNSSPADDVIADEEIYHNIDTSLEPPVGKDTPTSLG